MGLWNKLVEIWDETKSLLDGRAGVADALITSVLFAIVLTVWDLQTAIIVVFGIVAWLLLIYRYTQGVRGFNLLGGILGAAVAVGFVYIFQSEEAFFAPSLITNGLVALLGTLSILVKRPFVAWNSAIARRWPWGWYWHDQVRPAYTETTILWVLYFGGRLLAQWNFYQEGDVVGLAWLNLLLGWPATTALLVTTYIYGIWRLRNLGGPSVQEFKDNTPPPWESQQRGF